MEEETEGKVKEKISWRHRKMEVHPPVSDLQRLDRITLTTERDNAVLDRYLQPRPQNCVCTEELINN